MTQAASIFGLILRRLLRLKRLIPLALVAAIPGLLLPIATSQGVGAERAYRNITVELFLALALPFVTLLLASAAFGDERRASTTPYLVLKPIQRVTIVVAVTGAGLGAALAVGGIGWATGSVIAGIQTGDWTLGLPVMAGLVVNAAGYTAVFVPLGYFTRRAVLIGLAYIFVWETIMVSLISALSASSIYRMGLSAYVALTEGLEGGHISDELLGTVTPGVWGAMAKVGVLLALSVALMRWVLRTRDIK